ncbi:MAG: exonuclease domain-containing protein [Planctomycetes bacterium]|nr:exonuclease domain-containing protein [Planctomycetota bacterium]
MDSPQTTPDAPAHSHYLVLDLEATCCDQGMIPREETEIIEIGAVMVDSATLKNVAEFATFVRPVRHPRLTEFCLTLTSITQDQVDGGVGLAEAMRQVQQWADRYPGYLFCSWGDYDRNQILRECEYSGFSYPFSSGHLNLKRQFSERQGLKKRFGMAEALHKVGLPLDGTHHRGIDDARNIARLLPYIVEMSKIREARD